MTRFRQRPQCSALVPINPEDLPLSREAVKDLVHLSVISIVRFRAASAGRIQVAGLVPVGLILD